MPQYAVGIDIGGTRTKAGLVDIGKGLVTDMILTPTERENADLFIENMHGQFDTLMDRTGISVDQLAGIGIGVPGFVYEDGSVDSTFGFIPFMDLHYPLKQQIEKKFGCPCMVDNDARIVALGESLYGRGKGHKRVLVLTLGTGLGIGLVVEGNFETSLPYAHLGGHITIASSDIVCYCGRSGCMEALVSATGIINAATHTGLFKAYPAVPATVEGIFAADQEGNTTAKTVVDDFLDHLTTGISNYITLFVPDIIIIGGGVSKGLGPYLDRISKIKYLSPFSTYGFEVALSQLDENSGILGSAALFLQ
jgi:glucokinase